MGRPKEKYPKVAVSLRLPQDLLAWVKERNEPMTDVIERALREYRFKVRKTERERAKK